MERFDEITKIAENRTSWNARADAHVRSAFYGVEELIASPSMITDVAKRDLSVLEPHLPASGMSGLSVLHLQCHIGTDTLSFKRLGAREVWGLDFSPTSLEHAREIARRAGETITYVEGDARFASDVINRSFDVIVTSTGTITWLPELENWSRSIARLLAPGGLFMLRDDHPLLDALGYEGLLVRENYFGGCGSIDYEENGSYAEDPACESLHTVNHNWRHDFGEIVGCLLNAGLSIEAFDELPFAEWRALPFLEKTEQGWTMPEDMPDIPLNFSIVARKNH